MLKASDIDHWQSDVIFLVVPIVNRWPMFVCITYYFFIFPEVSGIESLGQTKYGMKLWYSNSLKESSLLVKSSLSFYYI